jgi:hypothetical protein
MFGQRRRTNKPAAIMAVPSVFFLLISIFGFSAPVQADSFPNAGFEDGTFTGWEKGTQTGTLGTTINGNGTGVTIFTGSRTFTHSQHGAMGSPTKQDGSENPYYAPAVAAGSWTFGPNNASKAVALQPVGQITFSDAMTALGLSGSPQTAIQAQLTADRNTSGFGSPTPTNAAWITREVQLTAGTIYTMSWNYLGTDYVPYNDGSVTALVPVTVTGTPVITVNNYVQSYALLGFTNPGTGDYSTNSYGATGWQTSTYEVDITGTYKLGFAVFNLGDTGLSPVLMIDSEAGSTERCVSGTCTTFGGVEPNNETAPTAPPTTAAETTTTTSTSTTSTTTTTAPPAPTSLVVTSLDDTTSSGTLRWAITQANATVGGIYDSITFDTDGTISLTSSLPAIVGTLTITGNGRTDTIIDGNNAYRPFYVGQGNSLTVSNMTLKKGLNGDGGLIFNTKGTVSANNVRFTGMSGGTAVFNKEDGTVATYENSTFDYLNVGISADHGSTPSLAAGITTWEGQQDSLSSNRTYVDNCIFDNNNSGINSQRFTKVENSTFTNNSYAVNVQGWNRSQVLDSLFTGNGIGVYHNAWISPTANMGTNLRLIDGNTFEDNGISIYLDDTYDNGQKNQNWATVSNNSWDANGVWVRYYQWNGTANAEGTARPYTTETVFTQSLNTFPDTIGAPSNLTATDTGTSIVLSWSAPTTGGYLPERYAIGLNTEGQNGWGIATGNVGGANSLNTILTIDYSLLEGLMPSGTTWSFHVRSDNDTFGKYSANSNVVSIQVGASASTTTTSSVAPAPEQSTTPTQPVVIVAPVSPEPEPTTPEESTITTEPMPIEEIETEETLPESPDETVPSETETETESTPSEESTPEPEEVALIIDSLPDDATAEEVADAVFEAIDGATAEEVGAILESVFEDATSEEVVAILSTVFEDASSEEIVSILSETFADGATDEEVTAVTEALLSDGITAEAVSTLIDVLDSGVIDESQVQAVIDAILVEELNEEVATELATSAAVIQNITAEQATDIFQSVPVGELSAEDGTAIVDAVQDAPTEVKESFEEEINVFAGVFDDYVALGSSIDVGTRRSVIAVNLVTSTVALAAAAGGLPTPSSSTSTPKQDMAARKPEEEEEEGGAIEGEGPEWIKRISIYKYEDGERVMDWKNFTRKFVYGIMASGFTLAGATVMYFTLSGLTQQIALWGTVLAFTGSMYLHMKEPDSE